MMTSIQESAVEKATFGGGCFWGVEETFRTTPGVIATRVGYAGGTMEHPSYEDVCTDHTGHAEVVEVTFDPAKVSYDALLDVFFRSHNPTTRNRQGPDVGSQYRSTIFTHSDAQKKAAHEKILLKTDTLTARYCKKTGISHLSKLEVYTTALTVLPPEFVVE
jgi:peptide-methionine (S)-S-oxide reductase